jgi:hypothetical protein
MAHLSVGLAATKAAWSAAFRSYVRDHSQGVDVDIIMDRAGLRRGQSSIDVLVVDDVMRTFSAADVAAARDIGIHVVGVCDQGSGMGRQYLLALGVDDVMAGSADPQELLALVSQVKPRTGPRTANGPSWPPPGRERGRGGAFPRPRAVVSAWTKVSGGAGLSEAVAVAAEHLAGRARVLVVEAEEVAPVLVSRLLRSPEGGLPWALARVAQGLRAFPEGLSGPREDGTPAVGRFDVTCAAAGAPHVISPVQLGKVLDEAASSYEYVLVETGWLVGSPSARERFSASRSVLQMAASIVVLASPDPEGAARLVQWKAAALAAGVNAPCWAAFGRARKGRYERQHLRALVEVNTGRHPFAGFAFLPEDATAARARWNGELAWKGPWQAAVRDLVSSSLTGLPAGAPALSSSARARSSRAPAGAVAR